VKRESQTRTSGKDDRESVQVKNGQWCKTGMKWEDEYVNPSLQFNHRVNLERKWQKAKGKKKMVHS